MYRQNVEKRGIHSLLRGHEDIVYAIKFFPTSRDEPRLLASGSADGYLRLWQTQSGTSREFNEIVSWKAHAGSINCMCVDRISRLIVSGSADGTLKIWGVDLEQESKVVALQTIDTELQLLPLALAFASLGSGRTGLFAVAGTKGSVQIWTEKTSSNFQLQITLVGHESWIRSLAISKESDQPDSSLFLASASQDKYIRLWRIRKEHLIADGHETIERNFMTSLSNKAHRLQTLCGSFSLTFEALLLGHEDWIYTVQWHKRKNRLNLLSASADNSLSVWEADESSGIWVCKIRLGEISSQKGSTTATGTAGGFWLGLWSPDGESVVSLGRTGSWRVWSYQDFSGRWLQRPGISGHIGSVTDIAWAKDGTYLLSTGMDQTTRLHACWFDEGHRSWHEFARPQIHGYDLNCVDTIGHSRFISGADEKALRVFDEPKTIATLLEKLCDITQPSYHSLPDAASIPMLGLSNKAVDDLENATSMTRTDVSARDGPSSVSTMPVKALDFDHPPFEDHLARHTLWPESEKLYGHGYEISAVAASNDGTLVATACKASSIDHAVIRFFETRDWREVKPGLRAHSLTVTCLRFSADDRYLLSVGRDRQWAVFERHESNAELYELKVQNLKGHSRMILSASWAPVEAGRIFTTAGRDKVVKVWKLMSEEKEHRVECLAVLPMPSPVTAVDVFPQIEGKSILIAVGTEDTDIHVYTMDSANLNIQKTRKIDQR